MDFDHQVWQLPGSRHDHEKTDAQGGRRLRCYRGMMSTRGLHRTVHFVGRFTMTCRRSAFRTCMCGAFAVLVATGSALADVPRLIAYQGRLTNPSGQPLGGPVNLVLRFYDASTAGNTLFTETQNNVPLTNGVFAINI